MSGPGAGSHGGTPPTEVPVSAAHAAVVAAHVAARAFSRPGGSAVGGERAAQRRRNLAVGERLEQAELPEHALGLDRLGDAEEKPEDGGTPSGERSASTSRKSGLEAAGDESSAAAW